MVLTWLLLVVAVCAALGVLGWTFLAGAAFIRNAAAILRLAWEAMTAIPAVVRVAKRRLTGGRGL